MNADIKEEIIFRKEKSLMALKTILFSFYMSSPKEKKGISELMNEREIVYKRAING